MFSAFVVPLLAAAIGQTSVKTDWPQWRGAHRDGISTETGLLKEWPKDGPALLWDSKKVNGGKSSVGTAFSSIAVSQGKIFTMGDQRGKGCFVYCLDEKTGAHLWETKIGNDQGDGPRCTPTVDGNRVYATTRQGNFACLETENGSVLWKTDFKKDHGGRMMSGWDYSESPTIDGEKVVVTPGGDNAAIVAFDKKTGEPLWQSNISNTGGAGYASIVVATVGDIRQYVTLMGTGRGLVGVDAKNGKFLWNYSKATRGTAHIPTAIVKDDLIFTSCGYGAGSALLKLIPSKGGVDVKEVYYLKGNELQNHHGGMILLGNYLYGGHGHNDGRPFCLDLKSGKFMWGPEANPGGGSAAVTYADGHLYFRFERGPVALIEATPTGYNMKSIFTPKMGGNGWPHPVVANGRLYLRGQDTLQAFDIKAK